VTGLPATARPVLTVVPPWSGPARPRGPAWWWFKIREAAGAVRWGIVSAIAAAVALAVPAVAGQAWAEGFTVALDSRSPRTWRQHLGAWRRGNETGAEVVARRRGQRWDGGRFTVCCPFVLPSPPALATVAAEVVAGELRFMLEAQATGRVRVAAWRRILAAAGVMAAATVAAGNHRVTGLGPVVASRRAVVAQARHAPPGRPSGQPLAGRRQPPGRHARTGWRILAGRWLRDAVRRRDGGALRAAA